MKVIKSYAGYFVNILTQSTRYLNIIGIIAVVVLMLVITTDVIGRFIFNHPLPATIEITQYVMVIAVYGSVAYCAIERGHVSVELFVSMFPPKTQRIIDTVTSLLSLSLFASIVWASAKSLAMSWNRHEVSTTLGLVTWPFRTVMLIGLILLSLVLLVDFIRIITKR